MDVKQPAIYILASQKNGTLYVGVTSNLFQRIAQHKSGLVGKFTKYYACKFLVYYEYVGTMAYAIQREKYLKGKNRAFKIDLIEQKNFEWRDLYG